MASVGARWGWVCAWSTRSRFRHTAQRPASGGRQQAARWLRSQRVQTGAHSESARPSCRWGGSTAMGNRCRKEATGARRALIQLRGQCSHSAAPSVTFLSWCWDLSGSYLVRRANGWRGRPVYILRALSRAHRRMRGGVACPTQFSHTSDAVTDTDLAGLTCFEAANPI